MLRRLRRHHQGVLAFDDLVEEVLFVLDPSSGEPVLPVSAPALSAQSVMLYAPDDALANPDCLQVHASPEEIDPNREDACDRHGAYFGRPAHARWARLRVESAKRLDVVLDGDLVRLANPLRRYEGALCKAVNANTRSLALACERNAGVLPEQPVLVGVDPWGVDVRARFGIVRLDFEQPASTPAEAAARLTLMLGERIDDPSAGRAP
jgi:hypothetical protein